MQACDRYVHEHCMRVVSYYTSYCYSEAMNEALLNFAMVVQCMA